ncbi:MAG: hypothetical protein FWB83_00375 [Treponema sp.]|nr:hypothetical protein [Treponema sp.]MCL2245385.1 hypothetical protein [Treponema sp.]
MDLNDGFSKLLSETSDDLVKGVVMCDAYWVSPNGEMLSVKSTHIDVIIKNPEVFGFNLNYIKEIYDKYRETFGLEGKARDEIVEGLINKRWMRIRYDRSQDYYIIGLKYFDERQIDFLREWGIGLLATDAAAAIKKVYINDMKNVLETCNVQQLVNNYLYSKLN